MAIIRKLTSEDLGKLDIVEGFSRWISSSGDKGKAELRELLERRLVDGEEVLVAIEDNLLVGFAVVADWKAVPDGRALDSMEVAEPYRGKGIGSELIKAMLAERETIVALTPYPESGYEKALESFYQDFGFRFVSEDVMVRIPDSREKLTRWIRHLEKIVSLYDSLIKEMKTKLEKRK